jgi:ABC-type Fe3+ transport system permease subunit
LRFGAIIAGAAAWTALIVVFVIPQVLFGVPAFVLGESGGGFEIQSATATIATSTQSLFGLTPDNPLETTLSLAVVRAFVMGSNAVVAALAYMLMGFSVRGLRRLGHARTRLRPVTR